MNGYIAIGTAVKPEYNAARNAFRLANAAADSPFRGVFNSKRSLYLFLSGVGDVNAGKALVSLPESCRLLLDTGTCGALDSLLKPGDIIVDSPDRNSKIAANLSSIYKNGKVISGKQYPVDHDIIKEDERNFLFKKSEALGCNRESQSYFLLSERTGIPAVSIRMVSDNAGNETYVQFRKQGLKSLPGYYSSLFYLIFNDLL